MRQLKKLTCNADLCNIMGKPYEQNIIDLVLMTCEDACELKADHIEYNFYYNGTTTEQEVRRFIGHFRDYPKTVKVFKKSELSGKIGWFSILTLKEYEVASSGRAYHLLKEVSEQSLTQAILDYYNKAKLQIKLSKNNK